MRKGLFNGIKIFFLFFVIVFIFNVLEIRVFNDLLYTAEGITLAFFFCVINGMFVRL